VIVMTSLNDRDRYRPDQRVRPTALPLLVCGALLAAAAVAWVMKLLFMHGWYLVFLVPLVGGAVLGGVLYLLVGLAHCRIPWLAAALGLVTGLVAFLGYYHLCLVDLIGPAHIARVDLLPRYITARMRTDVAEDVGRPRVGNQPRKPVAALNWSTFVFELLIVAGVPAAVAWQRARRAYCPELRQWMRREVALFPQGTGEAIREALQSGQLEAFVARQPRGGDAQTGCRLVVEHAHPADGFVLSHPVYVSVEDAPVHRPWYWPRRARRTSVRQVALSGPEVLTLLPLFPGLANLLKIQHAELADLPLAAPVAPADLGPTDDVAVVTPVPEPYRQRVRGPGYALQLNLRGLIPLAYMAGGVGWPVLGGYLASNDQVALGVASLALGAAGLAWGIYVGLYCMGVYDNRWGERRLRAEVAQRPDPLVDPAGPDAAYVSLIPREHWTKVKWTMASDLLLMRIDPRRREVLLEGDCDRYRIPAGAVAGCAPECFYHPLDAHHRNEMWMVRLLVQLDTGPRELLLSVVHTDFRPRTNSGRRRIAEQVCEQILALRAPSPAG
jgi:hypothetical protein